MQPTRRDYSILHDFKFEYQPVGVKFLLNRPDGLEQTDKELPICRFFREAQDSGPFYTAAENHSCVDRLVLGMVEPEPIFESGQIGAKEGIYQEARANSRIYRYAQMVPRNTVRYVAFSSLKKLTFEPDLLIFTASPSQAEILFRAITYSTGKPITSKFTPVLMCAWLFAYPYLSGEPNYSVTGIGYGMRMQKTLPEGLLLISVPFDVIPVLLENLREMDWVLPMTVLGEAERKEMSARIMEEINREYLNG